MTMSTHASPPAVSKQLAAFSSALTFDAIPKNVIDHIKVAVLDGLGCCLVGAGLPWTRMVADMVAADGGIP